MFHTHLSETNFVTEFVPLVSQTTFQFLDEKVANKRDMYKFIVRVSLIEVFNEEAIDLLNPAGRVKLKVRDDEIKGISLFASQVEVNTFGQVLQVFNDVRITFGFFKFT